MISYSEALTIIQKQGSENRLPLERVPLADLPNRICAEHVMAPFANQPFDNSSRDGFALAADDLADAANDNPVVLAVAGHIAAGDLPLSHDLDDGVCYEIMTGAPLPPGCNTVVPVEKTERNGTQVVFRGLASPGDNVRYAGHDFSIGDTVAMPGMRLQADHILTLATLGISEVNVRRKLKAAVLSTGLEIVDDLTTPLKPGQIYNSTRPYLQAALPLFNIEQTMAVTVADDAVLYKEKLLQAVQNGCDIILSTGAVSAGVHDFVPSVLKEIGAEILFHKVAVRPGRPLLFARLPNNGPFFFGLPGNPASTAAGLRFFVYPLLRAMQGLAPETPAIMTLKEPFEKGNSGLFFFMRARIDIDGVEMPQDQQSFMVGPFARTNGWAIIDEDVEALQTGNRVRVYTSGPAT